MQGAAVNPRLDSLRPFLSLQESLPALLACLRVEVPMRLWMVGRLSGNAWTVIQADDRERKVKAGDSFPWPDTLCVRVLEHYGCCFAEDAAANPMLAEAPVRSAIRIGAYIGYPMLSWRGELLGTICAIDPHAQAPFSDKQQLLVCTIARTISTLVAHSFKLDESQRTEQRVKALADIDLLTGLPNLAGWQNIIDEEERAMQQAGEDALVAMVECTGADSAPSSTDWDNSLVLHAQLLKNHVRGRDVVARLGPNRFGLMLRGLTPEQGANAFNKISEALRQSGAAAAVGYCMRRGSGTLWEAARIADIRMYNDKLAARARREPAA